MTTLLDAPARYSLRLMASTIVIWVLRRQASSIPFPAADDKAKSGSVSFSPHIPRK